MDMNRPWNIAEQVIEDPTTKLRIEFSSVHTDEVAGGNPAPLHDQILYLRLWTTARDRVATYAFTRGGAFIKTSVEHVDPGGAPPLDAGIEEARMAYVQEAMAYNEDHPQGLAPHDAGQLVGVVEEFEDINLAKSFVGDI